MLALSIALTGLLSACLKTELQSPALPPKIFQLAAANRRPLHIDVKHEQPEASLGHQYLLIAIPFGRIASENVATLVQRALYSKLALKGYTPLVDQDSAQGFGARAPSLTLHIGETQASAFDLLFVRHLSCSLELKAQFFDHGNEHHGNASGSSERFAAFAFEKEMSLCFTQALDIALDRLLNDLRM